MIIIYIYRLLCKFCLKSQIWDSVDKVQWLSVLFYTFIGCLLINIFLASLWSSRKVCDWPVLTPAVAPAVPWMCVADLVLVVSAAISAPLKLKASRGPPTPINRNQASQPRVAQSLLGKRGFESVSVSHGAVSMTDTCSVLVCLTLSSCAG